jgi:hypothetical protein
MVMHLGNFDRIQKKDLSNIYFAEYAEFTSMIPALFSIKQPDQGIVTNVLMSDIDNASVWNGQIAYGDIEQTYIQTVQEERYSLGLKVDEPLQRNDMYGVVTDLIKNIATGMRRTRESKGSEVFTGAFDNINTADGVSLCNSAHPSAVGGSNQSNTGTTAFSPAAVEATRQLMVAFKTDKDQIMGTSPKLLLVSTDNFLKAWEFLNTSGKIDTANNNKNYYSNGAFKLVVWDNYLNPFDWFFIDESLMKRFLIFYEWVATRFMETDDFDTQAKKYAGYTAINTIVSQWHWVFGHNPA